MRLSSKTTFSMKGILKCKPGVGDEAAAFDRLAEAQDERLLRLRDDEGRGAGDDDREDDRDQDQEIQRPFHFCAPSARLR